jgi:hypothetical protein
MALRMLVAVVRAVASWIFQRVHQGHELLHLRHDRTWFGYSQSIEGLRLWSVSGRLSRPFGLQPVKYSEDGFHSAFDFSALATT